LTFFSENDDFVRETKIVPREENTVKVKEAPRKVTILEIRGNHVGKRDKMLNLVFFAVNPGVLSAAPQRGSSSSDVRASSINRILGKCSQKILVHKSN
jgi:hypothetical protein